MWPSQSRKAIIGLACAICSMNFGTPPALGKYNVHACDAANANMYRAFSSDLATAHATEVAYHACVEREEERDRAEEYQKRERERQVQFFKDAAKNGVKAAIKSSARGKDPMINKNVYDALHEVSATHAKDSAIDAETAAIGASDLPANDPALKIAERLAAKGYSKANMPALVKGVGEVNTRATTRVADGALGQLNSARDSDHERGSSEPAWARTSGSSWAKIGSQQSPLDAPLKSFDDEVGEIKAAADEQRQRDNAVFHAQMVAAIRSAAAARAASYAPAPRYNPPPPRQYPSPVAPTAPANSTVTYQSSPPVQSFLPPGSGCTYGNGGSRCGGETVGTSGSP